MENNKNVLMLTTILSLFFGFIPSLIIWVINKDNNQFAGKDYLVNLLNFELTLLLCGFILGVLNIIPVLGQIISGFGISALWIANIVLLIIAIMNLSKNQTYKFPFAFELIK